ncbi:hypothetical protein N658DRAFT_537447 [Parathielavia hyrcaniae]|uniref:Uncharacterized protein n=1 Tax=Parathielavia hyrcaniae TaxID=113614 RepID=A0AAN6T5W9_9PEZI|nr:hypothetical protein N658DRAFT_537447 [Parathielavia hyrcaniae]
MSNTRTSNKEELSFGVELEFLFYFQLPQAPRSLNDELLDADASADTLTPLPSSDQDGTVTLTDEEEARLPPAPLLPAHIEYFPEGEEPKRITEKDTARHWATSVITEAILSVPGARMAGDSLPKHAPARYGAMYLTRRFRLRVNVRTGFHCHVGAGAQLVTERRKTDTPEPSGGSWSSERERDLLSQFAEGDAVGRKHELRVFKRAAALMWAADGFLCHAHPPERAHSYYAPPIRFCSRLAHGLGSRWVMNELGDSEWEDCPLDDNVEMPRRAGGMLPKEKLPSHDFTRLDYRLFPATRPEQLDEETEKRFSVYCDTGKSQSFDVEQLPIRTVHGGVAHIMRCGARSEVADLLVPPEGSSFRFYSRPNYNFKGYQGNPFSGSTAISSGTVEFREATGSVAAEWVAAWASICLAFFRFARDAPDERYWAVIERLAEAEDKAQRGTPEEHEYDMIALLSDMGLFAEALFLEGKLRSPDRLRFWYPSRLETVRAPEGEPVGLGPWDQPGQEHE